MSFLGMLGASLARAAFSNNRGSQWLGSLAKAKVTYESSGPCGRVIYTSGPTRFDFYYEFGGGNVLALIDIPTTAEWTRHTGLSLSVRDEVLEYVANRVVADQTASGRNRYQISDDCIRIFT